MNRDASYACSAAGSHYDTDSDGCLAVDQPSASRGWQRLDGLATEKLADEPPSCVVTRETAPSLPSHGVSSAAVYRPLAALTPRDHIHRRT
jgi:hypothetical protein